MPSKNINRHWAEQDPNAEIPAHETKSLDGLGTEPVPTELEKTASDPEKIEQVRHVEA